MRAFCRKAKIRCTPVARPDRPSLSEFSSLLSFFEYHLSRRIRADALALVALAVYVDNLILMW